MPVVVGTAAADVLANDGGLIWWRAGFALIVGLSLQIGVNFANDYSDGVRGTDDTRVGPQRLVASGAASPRAVKNAAFIAFGVAATAGLALAIAVAWWLIPIGAVCILAAWYYTGGKKPYGYSGWGEISVFVFFGLVATVGSAFVQDEKITAFAVGVAIPVGFSAVALLVANNLRDLPRDQEAGKRTLAVKLGDKATRTIYVGLIVAMFFSLPYLAIVRLWALIALVTLPQAYLPVRAVLRGATGDRLIFVLSMTGMLQMMYGLALALGIGFGA